MTEEFYNNIEPASPERIEQIKRVAREPSPPNYVVTWSNYDVLSLIKVIEEYKDKIEVLEGEIRHWEDREYYRSESESLDY